MQNRARTITFSRNVFIPLTNACRNRCGYCGFRARENEKAYLMGKKEVLSLLKKAKKEKCTEALFTFGEKPEINEAVKKNLKKSGYSSFLEYLYELCGQALSLGLLPHTNAGILNEKELKMLKEVNASMGLMLENASERLCERGMPHENSPGKKPAERLKVIENAGKLGIPFTTGILIGIGETKEEVEDSILKIKALHLKHNHIQEIIIQNFKPKSGTEMELVKEPSLAQMLHALRFAKNAFGNFEIGLQIPPNLNIERLGMFLKNGANDLGGISPVTEDYINPEYAWQSEDYIRGIVQKAGFKLRQRLPVYPKFIGWLAPKVREIAESCADREGFAKV